LTKLDGEKWIIGGVTRNGIWSPGKRRVSIPTRTLAMRPNAGLQPRLRGESAISLADVQLFFVLLWSALLLFCGRRGGDEPGRRLIALRVGKGGASLLSLALLC
jgi:hypothetical protein